MSGGGLSSRRVQALRAAAEAFGRSGDCGQEADTRFALGSMFGKADQHHEAACEFDRAAELYDHCDEPLQAARARAAAGFALSLARDFAASEAQLVRAAAGLDALLDRTPERVDLLTLRVQLEELRLDILVEMGRADPGASDGGAEVLLRCDTLLALASASSPDADIRAARFKACHQKTRMLMLANDEIGALPYAREAADYAAHSADPEHRVAEPLMRIAVTHALRKLGDVAQAEVELLKAARAADSGGDAAMSEIVLWDLELLLRDDPQRAVVIFGELADDYGLSGDERQEAVCVFAYAGALERSPHRPDVEHDLEIFERYHRSLMLFDQFGDVSHAADAYYRAGSVLSRVAALHVKYRERAAELLLTAVRKFGDVQNWHGQGVAQAAAAELLNRRYEGVVADHATVERLFQDSVASFRQADRPQELAASLIMLADQLSLRSGATDKWLETSRDSVRAYDAGRASRPLPSEREAHDRSNWAGFLLIAGAAWDSAGSRKDEPAWQELVWGLDQVIKARSFQDEQAAPAVWQRFLASDDQLRALTAEVERAQLVLQVALREGNVQAAAIAEDTLERQRRLQLRRLRALAPRSEALLSLASSPMVALPIFRSRLAQSEMYVGFVKCAGDRLLRLRVTAEHAEFDAVEQPHIESYLQAEVHGAGFSGGRRALLLDAASRLIGPLPADVDTLLICPDRALITVPWHLLPTRSGSLLGDDVTTAVVPAAGALAQLRQGLAHSDAAHPTSRYLGVADDGGNLEYVDYEVENIRRNYFATDGRTFPTGEGSLLLTETDHVELLHLACHATAAGLIIGSRSITPIDLADLSLSAEILLLTGCNTGAFGHDENNEFFGIVRQLLVATRAKAAIVSRHPIFDPSGPLFSDLVVAALTHHAAGRPWPLPDHPLPVGQAVRWARSTMRRLSKDDAHTVLPDVSVRPRSLVWWSPWFVVGDPSARIRPAAR